MGSYPLNVELDVQFRDERHFADIVRDWLLGLAEKFKDEPWRGVSTAVQPIEVGGRPIGAAGSLVGTVDIIGNVDGPEHGHAHRAYDSDGFAAWLQEELLRKPHNVDIEFQTLNAMGGWGVFGLSARARYRESSEGWVRLQSFVPLEAFVNQEYGAENQARWLAALSEYADSADPGFGQIAFYHEDGQTALEAHLLDSPRTHWSPTYTVGACRSMLRGYGWLTIVPKDLADKVGGVARLVATRAFEEVRPLARGGLWLLATKDFRDFGSSELHNVFRALAPILRTGMPVRPSFQPPSDPPSVLIFEDAAAVTGQPDQ